MRKLLFPLIIGLGGIVILLRLAVWQWDRLEWKEGVIAQIEQRLREDPVPLPADPDASDDNYRTVIFEGRNSGDELRFLDSGTAAGTGHRIIAAFETAQDRRVMVDLGLLGINDRAAQGADPMTDPVTVQGNLLWPDDSTDKAPDGDEWYARDVAAMAQALDTEPVLIVLSAASDYDSRVTPLPVDTLSIKNDHLEYAITWLLLALVWASMTAFYLFRVLNRKDA